MPRLPIVFVVILVLLMMILGYFLIRSFLRGYTYDSPSKTQMKKRALQYLLIPHLLELIWSIQIP
jgi:uncharacterized protein YneF (UPF0154 family)